MLKKELLDTLEWQTLQKCWYAVPYLGNILIPQLELLQQEVGTEEFFDWDKLVLALNSKAQGLQNLITSELLSLTEAQITAQLIYKRFEQLLDAVNKQRQTLVKIYSVAPDPYWNPPYSRYDALTEIEKKLKYIKNELGFNISIKLWQQIVDDSNIELAEKLAKEISKNEKEQKWEIILNIIISLSFVKFNQTEISEAIEHLMNLNLNSLIKIALKEPVHSKILESALRIIEKLKDESWMLFLKSTLEKEKNNVVRQAILTTMKNLALSPDTKNMVADILINIISSEESDYTEDGTFFYFVREKSILLSVPMGNKEKFIPVLKDVLKNEKCCTTSHLVAIKVLAHFGVYDGLETALSALVYATNKGYERMRNLAIDALMALKDKRVVPYLLDTLHKSNKIEQLKQYKHAFNPKTDTAIIAVIKALNSFGIKVEQNSITGEWHQI